MRGFNVLLTGDDLSPVHSPAARRQSPDIILSGYFHFGNNHVTKGLFCCFGFINTLFLRVDGIKKRVVLYPCSSISPLIPHIYDSYNFCNRRFLL